MNPAASAVRVNTINFGRRRLSRAVCACALVAAVAGTASAQSPSPSVPAAERSAPQWKANRANPYAGLFAPSSRLPAPQDQRASATQPTPSRPIVKCGMTLIPGDPGVDPGMAVASPRDQQFAIRGVEPPLCR